MALSLPLHYNSSYGMSQLTSDLGSSWSLTAWNQLETDALMHFCSVPWRVFRAAFPVGSCLANG